MNPEDKQKKGLPESIEYLAEAIDKKGMKVTFGLEQQGHLELIESNISKISCFCIDQCYLVDELRASKKPPSGDFLLSYIFFVIFSK